MPTIEEIPVIEQSAFVALLDGGEVEPCVICEAEASYIGVIQYTETDMCCPAFFCAGCVLMIHAITAAGGTWTCHTHGHEGDPKFYKIPK